MKYLTITFVNMPTKHARKPFSALTAHFFKKQSYIIHFLHQTALNDFSSFQTQIQKNQIHSQKIQSAINETMSKEQTTDSEVHKEEVP